ncbi:DUF1684 domain-containing protein [Aquimarina brevivitae]|uniref:DUF1684 domain-containing protein n=1 Tax=Aquimarina brevivitae TaxID=323412 RepID=A0A4Q7PK41_9FLAO|nr:DUF1684 domain-containing protein [Aquimarina brevivitae]RZT00211.1 hypothetical protein EV197_1447 [Aquimarina brevivitae]
MKNFVVVFLFVFQVAAGQQVGEVEAILEFQAELNAKFASEETSPLTKKDLKEFKTLEFFKINTAYSIKAKFVRTPYETPFIMKTTTSREPIYVKYGEAHFKLKGKAMVLNIYQNQELSTQPEYENYLFLPFTDLSNGETTYAGGRFIDLRIPEGEHILIDFNRAYNPYCAYNERYSCPIPPADNHIKLQINAGVRAFSKHKENN